MKPSFEAPHCPIVPRESGVNPWGLRAPDAVVKAILDPGPMLVVGDAPGDPDCFGSALTLARAREGLGMPADAHVDARPSRTLEPLITPGELKSADEVSAKRYDTVVFVDNDGSRVGAAATKALEHAKAVVVIDHHDVNPTHDSLGLRPEQKLHVWKDTEADAAALMVLGATTRAVGATGAEWPRGTWKKVLEPALSAIYSDTRGLEASRARPSTVALLRGLVWTGAVDLERTLSNYGGMARVSLELSSAIQESTKEVAGKSVAEMRLNGSALLDAWDLAHAEDPSITWSDMFFAALDHVEDRVRVLGSDVAVFVAEARTPEAEARLDPARLEQLPPKASKFSVRSTEGALAPALARALGGGGKPHEGGGISHETARQLFERAARAVANQTDLAAAVRLWNQGGI